MRTLLLFTLLVAPIHAGVISAPERIEPCSGLVFVTGQPSVEGSRIAWIVLEPFGMPTVPTKNGFAFAAPAKMGSVKIVLIEITPTEVDVAIHEIKVGVLVPVPPTPSEALTLFVRAELQKVPAAVRGKATELAVNHIAVAASIEGGAITSAAAAHAKVVEMNRAKLGNDIEAWRPFFLAIGGQMRITYPASATSVGVFREALYSVARGLQ